MYNVLLNTMVQSVLALGLLITSPLLANPTNPEKPAGFQAYIYSTETNKVRLAIEKTRPEALFVSLRQKGQIESLFRQHMPKKQTQLALSLDVTDLADGDYEVVVQSAGKRLVKQLSLGSSRPAAPERLVAIVEE